MRRRTALSACLAAAALVTACADDGGDDDPGAEARPVVDSVDIEDSRYQPERVVVPAGTQITFTNLDAARHTVTADDDSTTAFDSGLLAEGDRYEQTFDEPGTYRYICTVHPTMRGEVIVDARGPGR